MKILVTGAGGYLGQHLLPYLKELGQVTIFVGRVDSSMEIILQKYRNVEFTHIYHLASPTTVEDFEIGKDEMNNSIVIGTLHMTQLANILGAKLIFFSSEAVIQLEKNEYGKLKKIATNLVEMMCEDYQVLIIPRVYSSDRRKGIIPKLKRNQVPEKDLNNTVEYMDLNDFIKEFKTHIESDVKKILFNNKKTDTLRGIKVKYTD